MFRAKAIMQASQTGSRNGIASRFARNATLSLGHMAEQRTH